MLEAIITSSCAAQVHPTIVNAIVKTESNFNPFAIGINKGAGRLSKQPTNYAEAVTTAKQLLARGANIDMGLAQINSSNMKWLGLTVEQAFHPCSNLQALQVVYLHCLSRAGETGKGTKMQRAFSCYNTGNMTGGFKNGYVTKVTNNYNSLMHSTPTTQIAQMATQAPTSSPIQFSVPNTQIDIKAQTEPLQSDIDDSLVADNTPTKNTPTKVYASWDVFKEFN